MIQIIIQMSSALTQGLSRDLQELGIVLQAMHPGVKDPLLASFYLVEVPDRVAAEQMISRLLKLEGIEAAYLKSEDELPQD